MAPTNTASRSTDERGKSVDSVESPNLSLDDEFDAEMLAAFKIESDELLEVSESQLLILESSPTDATALNALFRAFHTIKGNAGFLKIDPTLSRLAHDAETVLSLCRTNDLVLEGAAFELILETSALMRVLVQAVGNPVGNQPSMDVMRRANDLRSELSAIAQATNKLQIELISAEDASSMIDAGEETQPKSESSSSDFFEDEAKEPAASKEENSVEVAPKPLDNKKTSQQSEPTLESANKINRNPVAKPYE